MIKERFVIAHQYFLMEVSRFKVIIKHWVKRIILSVVHMSEQSTILALLQQQHVKTLDHSVN